MISALATSLFNFNTTAWNLGEKTSFIELDTKGCKIFVHVNFAKFN